MKKLVYPIVVSALVSSIATVGVFHQYYHPVDEVKNYLIANPEFLIQVGNALNEKQEKEQKESVAKRVLEHSDKLLNENNIIVGKMDAPITIIEFFDYQCPFCQRFSPAIKNVMENNDDVRVIFIESPVLSNRFPLSALAAKFGISIYASYGSEMYKKYHDELFGRNIPEGELSIDDLKSVLESIGVEPEKLDINAAKYSDNIELFRALGLGGTPSTIVMPTKGANSSNIFLIDGAQPNLLFAALNKLKG
ncbi:thioredoxin domain-containing protein [Vibrio fluvialis]|nr:thioredoxin domain-containing protein [Vibrio fluvialis]